MTNNPFMIKIFSLCLCAAFWGPLYAQEAAFAEPSPLALSAPGKPASPNAMTDGIAGMLINNMVTSNGHQFFYLFGLGWQERSDAEIYSLSLVETTSRQRGSQVYIYAGNRLLFSGGLPYKSSQIRLAVDQALEAIGTRLISASMESDSADTDLGKEEL